MGVRNNWIFMCLTLTVTFQERKTEIITSKGIKYTNNGVGEFYLLKTAGESFIMQARTSNRDLNGELTPYAKFVAFVAKEEDSDPVQVELSIWGGLELFVNYVNNTQWFSDTAQNAVIYASDVSINKKGPFKIVLEFVKKGFVVEIERSASTQELDFTLDIPSAFKTQTQGLINIYDGSKSNKLISSSGTELDPCTATDREVFYNFGETWRLGSQKDSFFVYHDGETMSSFQIHEFEPEFKDEALNPCNDKKE